jgi:hypothetical protein
VVDSAGAVRGLVRQTLETRRLYCVPQVKVPVMAEPVGDVFTFQPATPACFCRSSLYPLLILLFLSFCFSFFCYFFLFYYLSSRNPFLSDPYEQLFVQVPIVSPPLLPAHSRFSRLVEVRSLWHCAGAADTMSAFSPT